MVDKFSKYMIDKILTNDDVRNKLKNKRKWLKTNKVVDYTNNLLIDNEWSTFLPPLKPVNVEHTTSVGENFKKLLDTSICKKFI